jgi:predicted cupin superfamily sugar epimerase
MKTIQQIIKNLDLKPHPEGGYFKETYRSTGLIKANSLGSDYSSDRNFATCIYFLLTSEKFSAFHRIIQDEIWHFYKGLPILLHMISQNGDYTNQRIGNKLSKGEVPQIIVPGGNWFAAEVLEKHTYALAGCTVSPGFSFEDFELIPRKDLVKLHPHLKDIITKLTHQ